jgi:hypothetical protein
VCSPAKKILGGFLIMKIDLRFRKKDDKYSNAVCHIDKVEI